ncbi:hypothetical protein [Myceligenerans indicum]|uniref:Uncharacterized protein n=1 Tax=Myceligenerans indicum TaxID=2593663 RepID=A0ABS1LJI7_9MICO|nr:hypothetical protein [Myceligenerans indicum]MBL0886372.1 hypothetical protein [Myceligenerans indicum]
MQDSSASTEPAANETNGRRDAIASPDERRATSGSDGDSAAVSTLLVETLPGVAVVFGEVPAELDLLDFGLVPTRDRKQISTALASVATAAGVGGNLGTAMSSAQGLYRLSDATQTLLKAGGTLATKGGANLGTVVTSGGLAQARFIPVATVSVASAAAAIGPVLAMVALQMTLNEITGLVRSNIALTSQVLTAIRHEQWAELTGLVDVVDDAVAKVGEVGAVPGTLWDTVAARKADLGKQLDLYRRNVGGHVRQLDQLETRARREYLQTNAEAIVFDSFALLSSVKAWTGYQALHAARARAAGAEDADEARLVEIIAENTREVLDSGLAAAADLIGSLTRELRIIAELPGPATMPMMQKRKDSKEARLTAARLLEAIAPLADALRPPSTPLEAPGVVCAPTGLDHEPYLRLLQWFIQDGEALRCLAFPYQPDVRDVVRTVGNSVLSKLDRDATAGAVDNPSVKTLVAVTDRRILVAQTSAFRQQGEIGQDIPLDEVRYVRAVTARDGGELSTVDLITREENIQWRFGYDTDDAHVDGLAAVLAESMAIPDAERDKLERRGAALIAGEKKREYTDVKPAELTRPQDEG